MCVVFFVMFVPVQCLLCLCGMFVIYCEVEEFVVSDLFVWLCVLLCVCLAVACCVSLFGLLLFVPFCGFACAFFCIKKYVLVCCVCDVLCNVVWCDRRCGVDGVMLKG